ncbi:MAG: AMP-dependent synthetase and ligase [Caulobacteraceae bacterium]|nr:AMP-dependent synthetase and ligase [Caulobacteraceae bacterium]
MRLGARIRRELKFLKGLRRTLKWVKPIRADSPVLCCDDIEAAVDRFRDRPAVLCEGRSFTYGEFDALANRYAHWAKAQALTRGTVVALFMPNRAEYLAVWYGLSKVGVTTALINSNLTGPALAHCLTISGALHCLVDADTSPVFQAVGPLLARPMREWTLGPVQGGQHDLNQALKSCSSIRPDRVASRPDLRGRDTALLIFTSGTTGLPKAARMTHMRVRLYMRGFAGATGATEKDRIYNPLPLYHATGGLCAVGAALLTGASVVIRRRFSSSHFWQDIDELGCTMFVYIGELARYLLNQPPCEAETRHKLRLAFGNGLREDVWRQAQTRFRIPDILEFYGATEGNVSLFNFDGRPGACGRVPGYLKKKFNVGLARFDVETEKEERGSNGLCLPCKPGQIGECLGKIGHDARTVYAGYADKAASERKVLHDVFAKGDSWFRTGDLMRQDADGYLYFIDRIGDTFRWKGENVSTGEVAQQMLAVPGVQEANVYGVPIEGSEGRAGMAALVVAEDFDIEAFAKQVGEQLPAYAQPQFLRMLPALDTTGTFKQKKTDLVAAGFNPDLARGPLYYRKPGKGYLKLTRPIYAKILAGEISF